MKLFRKLYDWVLHWANTPYGIPALFILSFAEASFFPIPPDVLLIALAISIPSRALSFAAVCSIASLIGGIAGYGIGWGVWEVAKDFFFTYIPGFSPQLFGRISEQYEQYNFWIVFTAGFSPIPYKVITISAGVFNINFAIFVLASAVSRTARFFLVAGLIYRYGPSIRKFIERYFNLLSYLFIILLIGGFITIKYLV